MIHCLFIGILAFFSYSEAFAGGDSAPAKIQKISYRADGRLLIEFHWVGDSGFMDGSKQTKGLFDFYSFHTSAVSKLGSKLSWATQADAKMPKAGFEACADLLIESYKSGSEVEIGQVGGGSFQSAKDSSDTIVVPYAKVVTTLSGKKACMFAAQPLK